jgi:uncharacterized membrane protein
MVVVDSANDRREAQMENVLTINFTEDGNAYEALTNLKELDEQGQVALKGAAVVMRHEDGTIAIKDEVGDIGYEGTATGGVVGLIVGILGGPIGVLLGGATGVLIGSLFDMDDLDESDSVLEKMSRTVRVGHASVVAEVDEQGPEVIDAAIQRLNGTVLRLPLADVEAEIAAAEEAQRAAKKEARKKLHEERQKDLKEKVQAKIAELKSKLHIDQPASSRS